MVGKVECRNGRISRDLFGFGDFIAIKGDKTVLVQCTDHTNFSKRLKKVLASAALPRVLEAWEVWVIGFRPDEDKPRRVRQVEAGDMPT